MTFRHDARWIRWYLPALIALVTFSAYISALRFGFVWDDEPTFIENPHYRGLGWTQLRWMWTTFYLGAYRPLTWMTHGLDDLLWGWRPERYHIQNTVFHVANAVIVYFVAGRALSLIRPATESTERDRLNFSAAIAALVFAVHPLRVEPVAWVSGRADVLAGSFVLLSVLAYLHYRPTASAALYLVSLISKPVAVSLPLVLLVLDVYPLKRLSAGSSRAHVLAVFREKIIFFALAAAAARLAIVSKFADMSPVQAYSSIERLALIAHAIGFYLWKTIAPFNLSPLYERPFHLDPFVAPFVFTIPTALLLVAVIVGCCRRWPAVSVAGACYFVLILPTSGVVQFGWQMTADRYAYVACVSWAVLAGAGVWRALSSPSIALATWRRQGLRVVCTAAVAGLWVLTWRQVNIWRTDDALWEQAIAIDPRAAVANRNMARLLMRNGKLESAAVYLKTAMDSQPRFAEAQNTFGTLLVRQGRVGESVPYFRRAVQLRPDFTVARVNLTAAKRALGMSADDSNETLSSTK